MYNFRNRIKKRDSDSESSEDSSDDDNDVNSDEDDDANLVSIDGLSLLTSKMERATDLL